MTEQEILRIKTTNIMIRSYNDLKKVGERLKQKIQSRFSGSSSGENNVKNCSATLLDLEALDCPVCSDALTIPIFQCDNGHIACSTCYKILKNRCPACALPVGHIRCRAMERVIQAVIVQCRNAKFGCTKQLPYGIESAHDKECIFSRCLCPVQECKYNGLYKDLYDHFDVHREIGRDDCRFVLGKFVGLYFDFTETGLMVMNEYKELLMFAVQCFSEPHGVYVTVNYIAPSTLEVGEFSCHISTTIENRTMVAESMKVKSIRELSFQIPKEDFILFPSYFLCGRQSFKLKICVTKLNQE